MFKETKYLFTRSSPRSVLSHRNSFFGDFILLSFSRRPAVRSIFENNSSKCLILVTIGLHTLHNCPSSAKLGQASLKLLLYLWNEQDMLHYESFPVIGDLCPKPFGQFLLSFEPGDPCHDTEWKSKIVTQSL